jgi:hypothetical protein
VHIKLDGNALTAYRRLAFFLAGRNPVRVDLKVQASYHGICRATRGRVGVSRNSAKRCSESGGDLQKNTQPCFVAQTSNTIDQWGEGLDFGDVQGAGVATRLERKIRDEYIQAFSGRGGFGIELLRYCIGRYAGAERWARYPGPIFGWYASDRAV